MKSKLQLLTISLLGLFGCSNVNEELNQKIVERAVVQHNYQNEQMGNEIKNPRTINKDGTTYYTFAEDWVSGFYPGSMWYMYELTADKKWKDIAEKQTKSVEKAQYLEWHHDIGFIIECSYGNGLRLTGNKEYEDIIITAAKSLSTRFREKAGAIQSWNVTNGWQSERGWMCPVIIDNMMNLELMFNASKLSGDDSFKNIAISHADVTLVEQFREDGSCYHVIDYDTETGKVRNRHTAQGYAHESAWSRGQSWAIYGYAVMYRFTREKKYLDQAIKTFEFMRNHPNMPEDLIPYWDMNAPNIPNELRDASSAAIIASALYEISTFDNSGEYKEYADRIMTNLASPAYMAEPKSNNGFILMHSVGSIPHNAELDVPLNYADYYFIEALKRKIDIEKGL